MVGELHNLDVFTMNKCINSDFCYLYSFNICQQNYTVIERSFSALLFLQV